MNDLKIIYQIKTIFTNQFDIVDYQLSLEECIKKIPKEKLNNILLNIKIYYFNKNTNEIINKLNYMQNLIELKELFLKECKKIFINVNVNTSLINERISLKTFIITKRHF